MRRGGFSASTTLRMAARAVAGIVDHDIEPAEVAGRLPDYREGGIAVGDIEGRGQHLVAVLLAQVCHVVRAAGSGCYLVAAVEGRDRPLAAEAAGCTGDQPCFRGLSDHDG